jgi:hypothetical protein
VIAFGPRWSVVSRVAAAILGGLLLAVVACVCLALWLPNPRTTGVAVGAALVIPAWLAAMSVGLLTRSAWRSWLGFLVTSGVLAGAGWLFRSS